MKKQNNDHECCDNNEKLKPVVSSANFVCPMHPEQTSDKPGMCPECHMALEKTKKPRDSNEHDKHSGHSPNIFKKKFWVSLILSLPIIYLSETIQNLFNFQAINFSGDQYLPAALGLIIFAYGGTVFLRSAKYEIQAKQPGMMTLISLAITVAFSYSSLITLGLLNGMDFWWELASLITIMLLGHWVEMASIDNAQSALSELAKLLPDEAEKLEGKATKTVSVGDLAVGDMILVRPGSSIASDGKIVKGETKVNEALLTGESKSVSKKVGDMVIAGSINDSGSITVEITKSKDDSTLSGIIKMVAQAQKTKSKTQLLADKAAGLLFYYALSAALITAISWIIFGDTSAGYITERVVAVLIIACPHALGLAIPLVTAISTTKAAKAGLLVRQRSALESARKIDVVLFDKTGTLTTGQQGLIKIIAEDEDKSLAIAASVESGSEHPISKAVIEAVNNRNIDYLEAQKFEALSGRGAKAKVDGRQYYVGGPALVKELNMELGSKHSKASKEAANNGQAIVYLMNKKEVIASLIIADVVREESKEAIKNLQNSGMKVAMLTGDSEGVASSVAEELGIDNYYAEVLPERKIEIVKTLQKDGSKVAMVGDGVNDAPALAGADIGIAIGAGTDVAIESAGIILAGNDPRGVSKIVKLSQKTYNKMVQNLIWATSYNLIAVPLAGGLFAAGGFVLSPAVGAALMSLSTVIVAANAQLLRKISL